jgi:phosphoribosyl 1,2-cyclic phosphodiesterase
MEFKVYASGSKANVYTVSESSDIVLIEMGLPVRELRRVLGFSLANVKFALLTHSHKDHSRSAEDVMRAGVDLYTSEGTIDALGLSGHRVHAVKAGQQFQVDGWHVLPVEAQHDDSEPLAFLIASPSGRKLLFATDTYYLKNTFVGLNIIAIECNYAADILRANVEADMVPWTIKNRLLKSHFSLENVKMFLEANDLSHVQEIHLLHLSAGNSDADRFKREIESLTGIPTYIAG